MSKIGPGLAERLNNTRDYDVLEVLIFLKEEPARVQLRRSEANLDSAPEAAIQTMQEIARASQAPLVDFLGGQAATRNELADGTSVPRAANIETFWINNAVKAEITPDILQEVLNRDDVVFVELDRKADLSELLDARPRRVDRPTVLRAEDAGTTTAPIAWSVTRINAPLLWQLGVDGSNVVVAVVDTGVNYAHPDLQARMWTSSNFPKYGYDFAADDDDPADNEGHGTCCAGIVAGDGSSGLRTGVAPSAKIMAIRVGGEESQFWKGMQFALEQRAHVISMSMTWKYPSRPDYPGWRRVCESVLAAGVLHANSIGNQGSDLVNYPIPYNVATPGNCPPPRLHALQPIIGGISSPISCGATTDTDALAVYSGRGPAAWESGSYSDYPWQGGHQLGLIKPDVCAPGPGTQSCNYAYTPAVSGSKPYVSFGGTSAATPHVAGCLALLASACLASRKPIVPARVQEALESTAVRVAGQTKLKENDYGAGRVDVKAAFDYGATRGWWGSVRIASGSSN